MHRLKSNWPIVVGYLIVFWGSLIPGATVVRAAISYGGGYYVNLCGGGTAASYYNCDPGCDPLRGSCSSRYQGVVKWICSGKWNQCLESESQWSNFEQVDRVGCGLTEQMSLFNKKCRREDESWDNSCKLLGYMVWYSGDCWEGGVVVTPSVKPTINPTAVIVSKFTNQAAASKIKTVATPTPLPVVKMCGQKCYQEKDCQVGFTCKDGVCRNPVCPLDKTCFCAIVKNNPSTGVETWLGMAGMVGLGILGLRLRKMAVRVWWRD